MPADTQKALADALRRAHAAAPDQILRARQLERTDRELLKRRGFLVEIIRGWFALSTPQTQTGDTTFWHLHFWPFAAAYLKSRFGDRYCLSAEHSLDLWVEANQTPSQLIVMTASGGVLSIQLPNNASMLLYPGRKALPKRRELKSGVQVMPLALALVRTSPSYFSLSPANAELALRLVRLDELARTLLSSDSPLAAANRIIGGMKHLGLAEAAERLLADLTAAGVLIAPVNPFDAPARLPTGTVLKSPYVGRIESMWQAMREDVLTHFPRPPSRKPAWKTYLRRLKAIYTHDAYNSLSIEGYQVTPALIERVEAGDWAPSSNPIDSAQVNAMAAKGYHFAFNAMLASLEDMAKGRPAGEVFARDLQSWYRGLFSPSVQAGLLPVSAIAGFRDRRVFIRGSNHVPPAQEAVPEMMETLFKLLQNEPSPAVRAVLGHFILVFIHPYSDGNGRLGRFLLNLMLASGGYTWTVVRMERRPVYMAALEQASVHGNITDFTRFLAEELKASAEFSAG